MRGWAAALGSIAALAGCHRAAPPPPSATPTVATTAPTPSPAPTPTPAPPSFLPAEFRALGGTLEITSPPGAGTVLHAILPL